MNRLWEEKGEGVDTGAAVPEAFPHEMVYGGSRGARRKASRALQHMHTYACAFWVDFGLIFLDFHRFSLDFP